MQSKRIPDDHDLYRRRLLSFFLSFFTHVEKVLVRSLLIFCICLLVAQSFILSSDKNQAIANKAARYEGVFQEDPVEIKATMKQK